MHAQAFLKGPAAFPTIFRPLRFALHPLPPPYTHKGMPVNIVVVTLIPRSLAVSLFLG